MLSPAIIKMVLGVPSVKLLLTHLATSKLAVVVTGITGMILSKTHLILQLNLLSRPGRNCLRSSLEVCSCPADVFLPNWKKGQPATLDVHVISTLQHRTLKVVTVTLGHTLSIGIERKMAVQFEACRAVDVNLIFMVMEGSLVGRVTMQTIQDIGHI